MSTKPTDNIPKGKIPLLTHDMWDQMFYDTIRPQKLDGQGIISKLVDRFKAQPKTAPKIMPPGA